MAGRLKTWCMDVPSGLAYSPRPATARRPVYRVYRLRIKC